MRLKTKSEANTISPIGRDGFRESPPLPVFLSLHKPMINPNYTEKYLE